MSSLQYGKKIITQGFHDGKLTGTKVLYEEPSFVSKPELLRQVIEAMSVITSGQSKRLELEIKVDTNERFKLIKRWQGEA